MPLKNDVFASLPQDSLLDELEMGGWMNNKCIYYVEGPCEQQLFSYLTRDVMRNSQFKKNLELLNRYCGKLHCLSATGP